MSALALRQGGNGPVDVQVDIVAIGDDFSQVLAAVSPAPTNNSDFDNDGDVDGADFVVWQKGQGLTGQTSKANGDANGDGLVNGGDLGVWKAHFGGTPSSAAVSAVPEPAAFSLLVLGVVAAFGAKRCL
jgi:hypothetical protein